jgi:RNA polymerase sigma-70 factor, ECF subfamily
MEEHVRASDADLALVGRLQAGDEVAFMMLVDSLGPSMRRVARMYVSTDAVADEVVQEAWLGVVQGLHRFEGRSSLRTWIFRILVNIAKTRGQREGRSVPFAAIAGDDLDQPAWDPSAFLGPDEEWAGHWSTLPYDWRGAPEARAEAGELVGVIGATLRTLPPMQAEVLRLRDVAGWSAEEVRNALDLTDTNQRVLLHRARAKVRAAVEAHLRGDDGT